MWAQSLPLRCMGVQETENHILLCNDSVISWRIENGRGKIRERTAEECHSCCLCSAQAGDLRERDQGGQEKTVGVYSAVQSRV